MKQSRIWKVTAVIGAILLMTSYAAASPGVVTPYDGSGMPPPPGATAGAVPGGVAAVPGPGIQAGADHIVVDQCGSGGWGWWPHGDCSATYNNITGPIGLGLLDAYVITRDGAHLGAAVAGGDYDVANFKYPNGESRFATFTPFFMWRLSCAKSDPTYSDHAATKFFDELTAGTYGPADYDTAGWIGAVQAGRAGTWVNLLPWEFHTLIHTAGKIGNAGQAAAFLQGLLDGLNTLDNTDPANVYSDLIGLAGGVRGLALNGVLTFAAINSPLHAGINGIDNLKDLADALAGYQNVDGSWYWHSNLGAPGESDKDTQTTAYAVLALMAADPLVSSDYSTAINSARGWLLKMQDADGSFVAYPGGYKITEVEAEALSGISGPGPKGQIPTISQAGLIAMGLVLLVLAKVYFGRRRAKTA